MRQLLLFSLMGCLSTFGQQAPTSSEKSDASLDTPTNFPLIGRVAPRSAREIGDSSWSIGGEVLDRDFASYEAYKDYLGPLGATAIRLQGGWAKTESEKGVYRWAWLDRIVDDAVSQGLHPWVQLSYGNLIYAGGGTPNIGSALPSSEEAIKAWDAWVRALVQRYKDRVGTWEIWNEPDLFTPVPVKDYAAFFVRTAEIIRQESPRSQILALSLGHTAEYADQFLDEIAHLGKFNLIDAITFHHYPINPDDLTLLQALRESLARHHSEIPLREGENGAPSRPTTGALSGYSWTELSQAKWDLRRMLAFHGNGVPFNLFTISDFLYPKGMNTKGLLEARPDHTIVGPKFAYRAAQHVFSIFNGALEPKPDLKVVATSAAPLAIYGYAKRNGGLSVVSIWKKNEAPSETNAWEKTDLIFAGTVFSDPVYVDLLSGKVCEIPRNSWSQRAGQTLFKDIPICDAPILIADRKAIPIQKEGAERDHSDD